MNDLVRIFPVNNGDTILIEADQHVVLTDINYRNGCTDNKDDAYDFGPELRTACYRTNGRHELDIFVLTHPDKDHLGGAPRMLHLDHPDRYRTTGDDPLILVHEIWVSPHAVNTSNETEYSKPVLKEIKRRWALRGTPEGVKAGNRLRVLSVDGAELEGRVGPSLTWELLGPTEDEANIPDAKSGEDAPSSNDSSLVIRWTLVNGWERGYVLLGGDAGVDVWERIWRDYGAQPDKLKWNVLVAPHHCSRCSMARKDPETEKYVYSADALKALGQVQGDGFVVSSSKPVKRDDDNPPSWDAKQRYLGILAADNPNDVERRFLNPESHNNGKPAPVVFEMTASGLQRKVVEKVPQTARVATMGASTASTYG